MWLFEVEAVKRGCVAKAFYLFDFNSHQQQVPICPHAHGRLRNQRRSARRN
jgi:hypothetical protein